MAEEEIIADDDDYEVMDDKAFQVEENIDLRKYETMKKTYKTPPFLTKYEKTKILSERAQQLTNGSEKFVEGDFTSTYDIALKELQERKIPFILKRPYGNTFEYWKVSDLI